mgnify:CR=1 FL=1
MAWAGHGQIAGQIVRTVAVGAIDFSHSFVVILVFKKINLKHNYFLKKYTSKTFLDVAL